MSRKKYGNMCASQQGVDFGFEENANADINTIILRSAYTQHCPGSVNMIFNRLRRKKKSIRFKSTCVMIKKKKIVFLLEYYACERVY
jgi:hypothetical protein